MKKRNAFLILFLAVMACCVVRAQSADQVGAGQGPGVRYATDAWPGFDPDKDALSPERKEPRWFAFWNGPKFKNAKDQFAYAQSLVEAGDWSKAAKAYDALVREWPGAEEAPVAQRHLAEIRLMREHDLDEAFAEYRYLADFYSFRCDYNAVVDKMYEIAGIMREEGKTIIFFHFRNTVDVRRAYECCVLRAPGAKWVPAAMLAIGALRVEEGRYDEAVRVYENLNNLYYGTPEAKAGILHEAKTRLLLLDEHAYNRDRTVDTIRFLNLAIKTAEGQDAAAIEELRQAAKDLLESEAYRAAKFYDSRMRTKRSAIHAYEQYLKEYGNSPHADEVRARLEELKGEESK